MSLESRTEVELPKSGNRLIDGLPANQRKEFLSLCERVKLPFGAVLCEAGEPLEYAYFPISGKISLVAQLVGHQPLETESIGSEGMLGTALLLNVNCASQRGIVQIPCLALRIKAKQFREALLGNSALCCLLQRYLYVVFAELARASGCTRFHDVEKRLARHLLLAQDSAHADQLPLTHQLLADMLGVQRGAVTIAAMKLQREGVIRYSRGKIAILDREGLEASSCECYAASIQSYADALF